MEVAKIYEDEIMVVVNKPAGVKSTEEGVGQGNSIECWAKSKLKNNSGLKRGGVVHRLDIGTSGLMVVAKNALTFDYLQQSFRERQVSKKYLALIEGDLPERGEIMAPIARHRYHFKRMVVEPEGKTAWTLFNIKTRFQKSGRKYALVEVELKTGRTHQIRAHFKYLNWPLVGDKLYGSRAELNLGRPFLHAWRLGLEHPDKGWCQWEAELPGDLAACLKTYEETT
jgi:23S rRNA pseudouridine1911/1915/1917 synthase